MIDTVEFEKQHVITLDSDKGVPQTRFIVRTLTRLQRIALVGLVDEIRRLRVKDDAGEYVPARYAEMMRLAYRGWEMLVLDVRCVNAEVPHGKGEFGQCVPQEWVDRYIRNDAQVLEVVFAGLAANQASDAVKKTLDGSSTSKTSSSETPAPSASDEGSSGSEAATAPASSSTPTSMGSR